MRKTRVHYPYRIQAKKRRVDSWNLTESPGLLRRDQRKGIEYGLGAAHRL